MYKLYIISYISLRVFQESVKVVEVHYGLKQMSKSWNMRFDEVIRSYDSIENEDESCVNEKTTMSAMTFLVLHVDEILLI